jgi:uncharacterized membrane-anchored protein
MRGMKKLPYSIPEIGFIVLVMLMPVVVCFAWRSASAWGFLLKLVACVVVGLAVWLGLVFTVCRTYDRSKQKKP